MESLIDDIKPFINKYDEDFFTGLSNDLIENLEHKHIAQQLTHNASKTNDLLSLLTKTIIDNHSSVEESIHNDYISILNMKNEFNSWVIKHKLNKNNENIENFFLQLVDSISIDNTEKDDFIIKKWLDTHDKYSKVNIFMNEIEKMGYSPYFSIVKPYRCDKAYLAIGCRFQNLDMVDNENEQSSIILSNDNKYNIVDTNGEHSIEISDDENSIDDAHVNNIKQIETKRICNKCDNMKNIKKFKHSNTQKTKNGRKTYTTYLRTCSNCRYLSKKNKK